MSLFFSGGLGYDIRSRGSRTERMWKGSAQSRHQWDRPMCTNGTASMGQASMGQANVHQWDGINGTGISGTASMGQASVGQASVGQASVGRHQWDGISGTCISGTGISGTGPCASVASPHFHRWDRHTESVVGELQVHWRDRRTESIAVQDKFMSGISTGS